MRSSMDNYTLKSVSDLPAPFQVTFSFRYSLETDVFPKLTKNDSSTLWVVILMLRAIFFLIPIYTVIHLQKHVKIWMYFSKLVSSNCIFYVLSTISRSETLSYIYIPSQGKISFNLISKRKEKTDKVIVK